MRFINVCGVLLGGCFVTLPCGAQLESIDASKLPQTPQVQSAYSRAFEVQKFAEVWNDQWLHDVPKAHVSEVLSASYQIMQKASEQAPANHELKLAAGLIAHLAYNVDVEAAYDPAVALLNEAINERPTDYRGDWFLGIHECQSLHVRDGMGHLLAVEARSDKLPIGFWDDYIACANVAIMPAHVFRAIDHAVAMGASRAEFGNVVGIANARYKSAEAEEVIDSHKAWAGENDGAMTTISSHLCGVSFRVATTWGLQIPDISKDVCIVGVTPTAKPKRPAATILLEARPPQDKETLEQFMRTFLKERTQGVSVVLVSACPVDACYGLNVMAPDIYVKQGGAHLRLVAFERNAPRYDGLPFEKPQQPPTEQPSDKPLYFRFNPQFRRIPGRLFYVVFLDSNTQIFPEATVDFDKFLKSLIVE